MIERIMTQPIFMFTRVALSALIAASAGILIISFLYFAWIFVEDVYVALNKEEVVIEETSIDKFPHIQPITVYSNQKTDYMIKKLLNIIRWLLILFLLLVLWISFGGSNNEENWRTKYYKQRALDRYDQACDKFNMTQAELNICSYKVAEEVDKEILKMTEDLEGFSLEDFKEFVHQAAIDQEYHGSIQPLRNNLFYIQKGAEYKVSIERKTVSTSILDDNPHLPTDCIRYIGMHIFTKDCIELMERWGGTWVNDSIMVFENDYSWHINAVDINKAYTADVYYTGKAKLTDANNRQDVLYLIYGHEFSYRVMNYENGKLEGVSTYFDKGGNPVLFEWYKDGELIEQSSGAHAVSGESIE